MRAFKITLYLLAVVPLLTGALDLVIGLHAQRLIGAQLAQEGFGDPLLNSQIRFFGAIWLGIGVLLFVFLSDISKYSFLLRISLGIVFLGGLGRVVSIVQFGLPSTVEGAAFVVSVTAIEIIGMPLLFWWHSHVTRQR